MALAEKCPRCGTPLAPAGGQPRKCSFCGHAVEGRQVVSEVPEGYRPWGAPATDQAKPHTQPQQKPQPQSQSPSRPVAPAARPAPPAARPAPPQEAPRAKASRHMPTQPARKKGSAGASVVGVLIVVVMAGIGAYQTSIKPKRASGTTPTPVAAEPRVSEPVPAVEEPLPVSEVDPTPAEQLSATQVREGIDSVRPQVKACAVKLKLSGTLTVKFTIQPDGKVSAASAYAGDLAKGKGADCVLRAVRKARFPSWNGRPMTVKFPFKF